jgi:hypothetical protein
MYGRHVVNAVVEKCLARWDFISISYRAGIITISGSKAAMIEFWCNSNLPAVAACTA